MSRRDQAHPTAAAEMQAATRWFVRQPSRVQQRARPTMFAIIHAQYDRLIAASEANNRRIQKMIDRWSA